MSNDRHPRTPQEVALIQAQLQLLADNPGLIHRMAGHRELDGLKSLARDSRRPTDARSINRYVADNRSYRRDQSDNYAAGLL
jgi:hypothetical protein